MAKYRVEKVKNFGDAFQSEGADSLEAAIKLARRTFDIREVKTDYVRVLDCTGGKVWDSRLDY